MNVPNYRELLATAIARLEAVSDSPRLDAELLLAHALDRPRSHLLAWPERQPDEAQHAHFESVLARRLAGEPMAHILGRREFWSLELLVTPDTLIPRPDTEILVETALEKIPTGAHCRVLDLGTGSGAIALALKKERRFAEVTASDASVAALEVARMNARRLNLEIEFVHGPWLQPFRGRQFEIIVGNPPYIAEDDPHLARGDVRFEPRSALAAGATGLDDIQNIIHDSMAQLSPGGWLLLEHGFEQADAVARLLVAAGFENTACRTDLSGQPRVGLAQRPG